MVSSFSLVILLAGSTLVRATIVPSTPETADAGSECAVAWTGDTNSTTDWLNMAIEFMTGDNDDMVFLTTVATGLDGTVDGSCSWICPEVFPYSAIYFYQFISPWETTNKVWTSRFAIASFSGTTTTPPNSTQPDGENISWGTGALVNEAVSAAPSFAPDVTLGTVITSAVSAASAYSSQVISTFAATTSGADNVAATSASTNSGLGLVVDERVWTTAFGAVVSVMVLALFL